MRYTTNVDNVTLAVNLDADTPHLELRGIDGAVSVSIDQKGLIVLIRRAFNDLFEEQKRREYEKAERERAESGA